GFGWWWRVVAVERGVTGRGPGIGRGIERGGSHGDAGGRTRPSADVLQVLAGLEPDGAARWDADLLARPRVAADAALARLHLEHAEATALAAVASVRDS